MITEIRIENFKSIASLTLQTGRVTVLIGENGSGKSNILEAIAFGAGAAGNKLDREFLYSRGIRVTEEEWMRSAFSKKREIYLRFTHTFRKAEVDYSITPVYRIDGSFAEWAVQMPVGGGEIAAHLGSDEVAKIVSDVARLAREIADKHDVSTLNFNTTAVKPRDDEGLEELKRIVARAVAEQHAKRERRLFMVSFEEEISLTGFLIYAPENSVLRAFAPEGAIEPLGFKGEGLLKLLQSFDNEQYKDRLAELKDLLQSLTWFKDFSLPTPDDAMRDRIRIQDGFLPPDKSFFDQRSANEGFLLLLFYFVLFLSWRTPKFFAIDNVDTALNPKLCATLMRQLSTLAAKYDKQVIFTTHNPAVLDGLDLNDDEQRLFTVSRNDDGATQVRRVSAPQPRPGERPLKLSEAFLRGLIGGLPNNF